MSQTYASYAHALSGKTPTQPPTPLRTTHNTPHQQHQPRTPLDQTKKHINKQRAPFARKQEHQPRTAAPESHLYVLTLHTTPSLQDPLNALRTQHFPAHLNRTPAHLTLFHALPGSHLARITADLEALSQSTQPFALSTGAAFRLRRGVGINVAPGPGVQLARRLHRGLQGSWDAFLSAQDRGAWRPHWTVQNKVDAEEEAARAMREVEEGFEGAEGMADGVVLWRYERGWWGFERGFDFGGGEGGREV